MIFHTHIPAPPLSFFVDSFHYFEGFEPSHTLDRLLPDGEVHVIIDLTDFPKYIYDNDTLEEMQAFRNVWASGMHTNYITIPSGIDAKQMIITFKKGMNFPFFKLPMSELTNIVTDAEQVLGNGILELRERMLETPPIEARFALLENFLLARAGSELEVNPFIEYAIEKLVRKPDGVSLKELSCEAGYSQKHFISLFKKHVGLSPKAFVRVMRFQEAVREIEQKGKISWTKIALDCGYYDQAHFINDFRLFSGFTPEEYLRKKNGQLNYVPVG